MNFYGEFVRLIDGKWRMPLPKAFKEKVEEKVYFYLVDDKVRIYGKTDGFSRKDSPFVYEAKIDN